MNHLQKFHFIIDELLRHFNFGKDAFDPDQEVLSIDVDGRFVLHVELLDEDFWLMHAELGASQYNQYDQWKEFSLHESPIGVDDWQPCIAIDEDNQLHCWLQLPLQGHDLPALLDAFDAVVDTSEQLLLGGLEHTLLDSPAMPTIPGAFASLFGTC